MHFSICIGPDFYIFLVTRKKSKKSSIYILDEVVHSYPARHRDVKTDGKETFQRTTTLQAGPINKKTIIFF